MKRRDKIASEMRTIGRGDRRAMLALEVVVQNDFAAFAGENEVDAGALEFRAEQQLRVRNDDGVRRNVVCMDGFGIKMRAWVLAKRVGNLGIQFAEVIHPVTAMVNKYIILKV